MDKQEELAFMRRSLTDSKVTDGIATTPERKRMLERDLSVVRIIGGYRGASPKMIEAGRLLPEHFSSKPVKYIPSGTDENVSTYAVAIPGTGCYLLPEAIGSDGLIHVQSEGGMNLGILVARAKSPRLNDSEHVTRALEIDTASTVNGAPLIYGDGANHLVIYGENTFVDVLPGRVLMKGQSSIDGFTELLSDKSKGHTGQPDMELILRGAVIPFEEEPDPKLAEAHRPQLTRGLSFGESVEVHKDLDQVIFNPSRNPLDTYHLKFVFD